MNILPGLENKDSGIVTYPLRGKLDETVVYLRSEAELVHYRDENTLELKSGFILINSMIELVVFSLHWTLYF